MSLRPPERRPISASAQRAVLARAAADAPWAFTVTDADWNILVSNHVAAELLGYSTAELLTLGILDTCPRHRVGEVSGALEELSRTGSLSGVGPALRKDGAVVIVRYAARRLDLDGHLLYLFCSFPVRVIDTASSPQARGGSAQRGNAITDREGEILLLVSDGYENDEIARRLHLSVNTVKTYVQRALAKLGARSRAHAVALAIRRGLIE